MIGKVKVWYMTEEERLAYIEKYPIKSSKPTKGSSFVTINDNEISRESAKKGRRNRWGNTGYKGE